MAAGSRQSTHLANETHMNAKRTMAKTGSSRELVVPKTLLTDVRELILSARESVATTVNATLTLLYWQIGTRIRKDILKEKRAGYGDQIVQSLAAQLEAES